VWFDYIEDVIETPFRRRSEKPLKRNIIHRKLDPKNQFLLYLYALHSGSTWTNIGKMFNLHYSTAREITLHVNNLVQKYIPCIKLNKEQVSEGTLEPALPP
jgi:hypothetical protein